jgi:hypothetical protein
MRAITMTLKIDGDQKFVLVKTICTFEHTYLVPMQPDMTVEDHLDYVTCGEIEETSQAHIDDCILPNSTRVVNVEEALEIFDKENDYLKAWSVHKKLETLNQNFDKFRKETN